METAGNQSTAQRKSSKAVLSVSIGMLVTGVITVISISGIRDSYLVVILIGIGIGISALGGCCLCCSFALQGSTGNQQQQTGDLEQRELRCHHRQGETDTEERRRGQTTNHVHGREPLLAPDYVSGNVIGQNSSQRINGTYGDIENDRRPFTFVLHNNILGDIDDNDMANSYLTIHSQGRPSNSRTSGRMVNHRHHSLSNLYTEPSDTQQHRRDLRWSSRGLHSVHGLGGSQGIQRPSTPDVASRMAPPSYEICAQDMTDPPSYDFVMSNRSLFNT